MSDEIIKNEQLSKISKYLRYKTIKTSHEASIPHLGSCLSCVEILVYLYWSELNLDPLESSFEDRDRFILSKGHGAPILFQVLAERNFFDAQNRLSQAKYDFIIRSLEFKQATGSLKPQDIIDVNNFLD